MRRNVSPGPLRWFRRNWCVAARMAISRSSNSSLEPESRWSRHTRPIFYAFFLPKKGCMSRELTPKSRFCKNWMMSGRLVAMIGDSPMIFTAYLFWKIICCYRVDCRPISPFISYSLPVDFRNVSLNKRISSKPRKSDILSLCHRIRTIITSSPI